MILTRDDLRRLTADFAELVEEFEEVATAHAADLAGLEGFGSDFIRLVVQRGGEAQHVAGAGDFEDHGAAIARGGGKLDLATADDEDSLGALTFLKDDGAAGVPRAASRSRRQTHQNRRRTAR